MINVGFVSAVPCWCYGRDGSGNTWLLYYDWALASHVVEYVSIVLDIYNIYLRCNNNNSTSM